MAMIKGSLTFLFGDEPRPVGFQGFWNPERSTFFVPFDPDEDPCEIGKTIEAMLTPLDDFMEQEG